MCRTLQSGTTAKGGPAFHESDDILCDNYIPQQRALQVRPCVTVMPQLYQHEILYRAHDEHVTPRYKCGTCGSCNCSCVQLVTNEPPDNQLARGAVIPAQDLTIARAPEHPQHKILTIQTRRRELEPPPTVRHIVLTVEKTFASVEPGVVPPLEITLKAMHNTSPSDCPNNRFKEWTQHDGGGLEFTLPAVITHLAPSITFGKMDPEDGRTEMVRCITAHQLWEKFRVASPPGDVYRPTQGLWLPITSSDETTHGSPTTLLICLKNLRTLVEFDDTLCFYLANIYRGKFLSQHWMHLIAIVFCRQAKIQFLDQQTYTPEKPTTVLEALSVVHNWSSTNMGDRPLRRTVWQDR